jgi:hypothetical protein
MRRALGVWSKYTSCLASRPVQKSARPTHTPRMQFSAIHERAARKIQQCWFRTYIWQHGPSLRRFALARQMQVLGTRRLRRRNLAARTMARVRQRIFNAMPTVAATRNVHTGDFEPGTLWVTGSREIWIRDGCESDSDDR